MLCSSPSPHVLHLLVMFFTLASCPPPHCALPPQHHVLHIIDAFKLPLLFERESTTSAMLLGFISVCTPHWMPALGFDWDLHFLACFKVGRGSLLVIMAFPRVMSSNLCHLIFVTHLCHPSPHESVSTLWNPSPHCQIHLTNLLAIESVLPMWDLSPCC